MRRHLNVKAYGMVQGVFFRYSAREKARELGLGGWVENLSDGSVYVAAEGEEESLKKFLDWCREGSEAAAVKKVEWKWDTNLKNFKDFIIKY